MFESESAPVRAPLPEPSISSATVGHRLTNGEYEVSLTGGGVGYSSFGGCRLTAWHEDPRVPAPGVFHYVRDRTSGEVFAAGFEPVPAPPGAEAILTEHDATFRRIDHEIATSLMIHVLPDAPLEVRTLTLTNLSARPRVLEVTSYAEVVLHDAAAHAAHPAFSKLFIQTEYAPEHGALLARRRARTSEERHPWLVHAVLGCRPAEYETDRAAFLGRCRRYDSPRALREVAPLSGSVGNVLDPIVALRCFWTLEPNATIETFWIFGAAADRESALALVERMNAETIARHGAAQRALATTPRVPPPTDDGIENGHGGTPGDREFFNGFGGFDRNGREYVMHFRPRSDGRLALPPRPWINVVSNEYFGFLVSETGAGSTWSVNSREHRITPWSNDPLLDPHGDAIYVRDEDGGEFGSLFPGPAPRGEYEVRHGFGFTSCRCLVDDLTIETRLFVPRDDPVRVTRIAVSNASRVRRTLSFFTFQRLILGPGTRPVDELVTRVDSDSVRLSATVPGPGTFDGRCAFATPVGSFDDVRFTTDTRGFLGANGTLEAPASLAAGSDLDERLGHGIDACFAHQARVTVEPGATLHLAFLLGEADDPAAATAVVERHADLDDIDAAEAAVTESWRLATSTVRIETPSRALDIVVNGWLAYQTIACRLWGRSALYQSGGAFGFRDQLQDAASLLLLDPSVTRRQILRNAAHQFVEGDVLHWWHPPDSRGIRTRFADDLLWLPYVTAHYVQSTGDQLLLYEDVRFLTAELLEDGEDERFLLPVESGQSADLYAHCCRAIDRSLALGSHGLPLFGTGDWNDGMNRVGREGRGESVWMAFFLYAVLGDFLPLCEHRGDSLRVHEYSEHRDVLAKAIESAGWDGDWYRRGYYDDGTPLGSRDSDECRIDALAQAWSVISGAAPRDRAERALAAVEEHLVSEKDGIVRLLTPPFENTPHEPGYIKGYVRGVRENGGQYTHAALWVVRAMAELGLRSRAAPLLDMLNPIHHARTEQDVARYQTEPYVVAADIYGAEPHVGRGGWTWYTGSSGWMLRVAIESVLGLRAAQGTHFELRPCVPDDWPEFHLSACVPGDRTRYDIHVVNPTRCSERVVAVSIDGTPAEIRDGAAIIPWRHDAETHTVEVRLGAGEGAS